MLDPFIALTSVAASTDRLRLGTGIALVAEHSILHLAKQIASVDVVSGGRFELGVGYGWNVLECANNGVDPQRRRAVLREKLVAMYRLWSDDVAAFDGNYVHFTPSWSWPKPVQRPRPPVLFGVPASYRSFADIAAVADGWMPLRMNLGTDMDEMDVVLNQLRSTCAREGRAPPTVTVLDPEGAMGGKRSIEVFRQRLPAVEWIAALGERGVDRLVLGIPSDGRSLMNAALDEVAQITARLPNTSEQA